MDDSRWWQDNPCPLNKEWRLQDVSDIDLRKLKNTIETSETAKSVMVIESLIYRAFLANPNGNGFYQQRRNEPRQAIKYLKEAEDCINDSHSEEAKVGYKIVIYTFRMWILGSSKACEIRATESTLKQLDKMKDQLPKYIAYVNAVHAQILSRLGPRYRSNAKSLYQKALDYFPENYEWLYGMALMVGREARHYRSVVGAWKSPLPEELVEKFEKEKMILKKILSIKQNFFLARAHYGQVLFNLDNRSTQAEEELKTALTGDSANRTISLLVAKFFRRKGLFSQAEDILKKFPEGLKTSEFNFQLGCVYRSQSFKCNKKQKDLYLQKALSCFKDASRLDDCHFPSAARCAEINAKLGKKEEARTLYDDLFEGVFRGKSYQGSNEFETLESALRLEIFQPLEKIKYLYRAIELAVVLTDESNEDINIQKKSFINTTEKYLQKIEQYTHETDETVRYQAQLSLADAKLLLKKFDEAKGLYKHLFDLGMEGSGCPKVTFGLGKCYVNQGGGAVDHDQSKRFFENAIEMAKELEIMAATKLSNELYADVYLAKAKTYSSLLDHEGSVMKLLHKSIRRQSLEGCYMYLTSLEYLKENFFSNYTIPETLVLVESVCANTSSFHVNFAITERDTRIVDNVAAKRDYIRRKVDEVKNYKVLMPAVGCNTDDIRSITDQLRELRQQRVTYELELLHCKRSNDYGGQYLKKLTDLIQLLNEILDNTIAICQNALTAEPPNNSMFIVKFDFKEGKVKQDKCQTEVEKWARLKTFRDLQLPDSFLKTIIEIQPMYHEQNLWLWAIHRINNLQKHNPSKCKLGEMFTIQLEDSSTFRTLKTEDIVKESCAGVEALTKELIEMCCSFRAGQTENNTNK